MITDEFIIISHFLVGLFVRLLDKRSSTSSFLFYFLPFFFFSKQTLLATIIASVWPYLVVPSAVHPPFCALPGSGFVFSNSFHDPCSMHRLLCSSFVNFCLQSENFSFQYQGHGLRKVEKRFPLLLFYRLLFPGRFFFFAPRSLYWEYSVGLGTSDELQKIVLLAFGAVEMAGIVLWSCFGASNEWIMVHREGRKYKLLVRLTNQSNFLCN